MSQSTRFKTERLSTTDQRRIAAAMEQIGWRRERPEGKQGKRGGCRPRKVLSQQGVLLLTKSVLSAIL